MIHTGERPNHCSQCDKTVSHNTILKIYLMIHTQDKPYQCIQCDKTFSRNNHLTNYMMNHTGERPYLHKYCNKVLTSSPGVLDIDGLREGGLKPLNHLHGVRLYRGHRMTR